MIRQSEIDTALNANSKKRILLAVRSRKLTACGRLFDFLDLKTLLIGGADFAGGFGGEYLEVPFFLCENELSGTITGRGRGVLNGVGLWLCTLVLSICPY